MPTLVQVARVDDVPPGTSRKVKVRGKAILLVNVDGVYHALEDPHALPAIGVTASLWDEARGRSAAFRTEVRAPFIFVALNGDRESAPADMHDMELHRVPASPGAAPMSTAVPAV